jgi:Tfp pilus assembly protein PilN
MTELVLTSGLVATILCIAYVLYQQTLFINEVNKRLLLMVSEARDQDYKRIDELADREQDLLTRIQEYQDAVDKKVEPTKLNIEIEPTEKPFDPFLINIDEGI